MGSATIQGQLWGNRARDWAAYTEQVGLPLFGAALDAARVTAGTRLLDAGCGAGLLSLLASLRGARVTALDASPGLLEVVRERLPGADVLQGDLQALPCEDASFDAAVAVNSLFYAQDMARAMQELVRVVRPGGRVVVTAWGPPARCEFLASVMPALAPMMPPPPPGAERFELWRHGFSGKRCKRIGDAQKMSIIGTILLCDHFKGLAHQWRP